MWKKGTWYAFRTRAALLEYLSESLARYVLITAHVLYGNRMCLKFMSGRKCGFFRIYFTLL